MRKILFYATLFLFSTQFSFSQSSVVGIIDNAQYENLIQPDIVYINQDSLPNKNGPYIMLNFEIPFFETNKVFFTFTGIDIRKDEAHIAGGSALLRITLLNRFETDGEDSGFITSDVGDSLKVKHSVINGLKCTKVEVINNAYDAFADYTFSYQYHFYENGRIEIHYGPNAVSPDFPSYSDMYADGTYYSSGKQVGYYILSENPKNPVIYDHISHPNPDTDIDLESFKPFSYFPDSSLSYYIYANTFVTDITEHIETHIEYDINISQKNILRITPITDVQQYDIQIFNALGQNLSQSSHNSGPSETDLKGINNCSYIFIRITTNKGIYFKKLSLK
jgi:hypothetical protein